MVWSVKVDGNEINDNVLFHVAGTPEIDNVVDHDVILVPMADRYPEFIRVQPTDGSLTMNLAMMPPCTHADYQTRLAWLKSVLTPGLHTLTVQVRGMAAPKSMPIVVRGMMVHFKLRLISVNLVMPAPVLV